MGILSQSEHKIQNYLAQNKEIAHQRLLSLCTVKGSLGKYSAETLIPICALYKHSYHFRTASSTSEGRFVLHFFPSRPPKQLPGLFFFFGPSLAALSPLLQSGRSTCPLQTHTHTALRISRMGEEERGQQGLWLSRGTIQH